MNLWQLLRRMRTEPAAGQIAVTRGLGGFGFTPSLIWEGALYFSRYWLSVLDSSPICWVWVCPLSDELVFRTRQCTE
jgi:hypothetical protein